MTIHSEHPFLPSDDDDRDPARQLRGRVGSTVSLWTAGAGRDRAGLTVSSYLVAAGDPSRFVAVLHPESELLERLEEAGVAIVALLDWRHREIADVFAGVMPAPGGPFRRGDWRATEWGPRLASLTTWAGVRLDPDATRDVGWTRLVEASIEHVELGDDAEPLTHRRGRYQRPPA